MAKLKLICQGESLKSGVLSINLIEIYTIVEALKMYAKERENAIERNCAELLLEDLHNREVVEIAEQTERSK